jgi:hypothetical protein
MLPSMPDPDSLIVIATHLRPEEAGMLRGLLESAGIDAVLRDDMLSAVNPFLQPAIGGVKLAVRAADAERALEIVHSAGALPGPGPNEPVDIPEDEWSQPPSAEPEAAPVPTRPTWPRRVVMAALVFALALAFARCVLGV